ncbi:hypothetical protein E3E12_07765 [Formicincola oecophyllae]|uniref:Uncharacterized protein n=1 Tax=Formicincola oecophyllae TaxID=2558361 RepID=A0A4Y6U9N3_9PROT|nr:hypothetical protein [Formicincola oecophyllae]QDH14092.1 hypothetical protein E3E12_07765 [Formicincola oecophyllae]
MGKLSEKRRARRKQPRALVETLRRLGVDGQTEAVALAFVKAYIWGHEGYQDPLPGNPPPLPVKMPDGSETLVAADDIIKGFSQARAWAHVRSFAHFQGEKAWDIAVALLVEKQDFTSLGARFTHYQSPDKRCHFGKTLARIALKKMLAWHQSEGRKRFAERNGGKPPPKSRPRYKMVAFLD